MSRGRHSRVLDQVIRAAVEGYLPLKARAMAQVADLIDLEGGGGSSTSDEEYSARLESALNLLDESIESHRRQPGARRRLLVGRDELWWRRRGGGPGSGDDRLDSLGDDASYLDAILGQLLPEQRIPQDVDGESEDRLSSASTEYHSCANSELEPNSDLRPSTSALPPSLPQPPHSRRGHRRIWSYSGAVGSRRGREECGGSGAAGRRSRSLSAMAAPKCEPRVPPPAEEPRHHTQEPRQLPQVPQHHPQVPHSSATWHRASMRRLTHIRLQDPPPPTPPPPPPPLPPRHHSPPPPPTHPHRQPDDDPEPLAQLTKLIEDMNNECVQAEITDATQEIKGTISVYKLQCSPLSGMKD
ncbi:hypothetical protein AAG570_010875 [Ranatra chinensis]|uniref:Uncharacterized protein n=1 Tax=Ranatra chinensis TaxID=642074 RepID=A0ABD0YXD7_9HEMI